MDAYELKSSHATHVSADFMPVATGSQESINFKTDDDNERQASTRTSPTLKARIRRAMNAIENFIDRHSPSLLLENKGATARDHLGSSHDLCPARVFTPRLANERTYLAYLRTSLSLLTAGIAITQLSRLKTTDAKKPLVSGIVLGGIFVGTGFLFILFGAVRYFMTQSLLSRGLFPSSRGSIAAGTAILFVVTVVVFIVTLFS